MIELAAAGARAKQRYDAARAAQANAPVSLDALRPASSGAARPNHQFITNTLSAVAGHNRRVEEGECWAAKRMRDERDGSARPSATGARVASFQYEHGHYETSDASAAAPVSGSMVRSESTRRAGSPIG